MERGWRWRFHKLRLPGHASLQDRQLFHHLYVHQQRPDWAPKTDPPSSWPAGNLFPSNPDGVDFTQYDNGNGGDYQLLPDSPYKNKGTDGRDLGADIVGLNEALAGVE